MSLQIQQACLADLPEIAQIEEKIEGDNAAPLEVLLERQVMFEEGFLVVKDGDLPIAYAESCLWNEERPSFQAERDFFQKKHRPDGLILYLIFLGVDPDHRRRGVASLILSELLKIARRMNVERVHAVTWDYLVPLYTKQGFKPIGQIVDFLPNSIVTHLESVVSS